MFRKLLEVISKFSKLTAYKMNTQKSLAFLCTNNETSEREIKVSIPFTIATKWIKCLGKKPKETLRAVYRKVQDTEERNQRQHKEMERYSMFLG